MSRIEDLKASSGLPGPRANLTLLHTFARTATKAEVDECLTYLGPDLANSPEEFVAMCGVLGTCVLNKDDPKAALTAVRPQASHSSWRLRESVALGIQEIATGRMTLIMDLLTPWVEGSAGDRRAVVAALCEPRLLKEGAVVSRVLVLLDRITRPFQALTTLSEAEKSLRKTLGYGWSVAVAGAPEVGVPAFAALRQLKGKHVEWIVAENLKKHRMNGLF